MKYFTPELYVRLQDLDNEAAFDDANKAWDQAVIQYEQQLDRMRGQLPSCIEE